MLSKKVSSCFEREWKSISIPLGCAQIALIVREIIQKRVDYLMKKRKEVDLSSKRWVLSKKVSSCFERESKSISIPLSCAQIALIVREIMQKWSKKHINVCVIIRSIHFFIIITLGSVYCTNRTSFVII